MPIRKGNAKWSGGLKEGKGHVTTETKVLDASYDFTSRFEEGNNTNPEELVAAAHAGCYSMALSGALEKDGYQPQSVETEARVHIEKTGGGWAVPKIELLTKVRVDNIEESNFRELVDASKENCPMSKLLSSTNITVNGRLVD